MTKPAQLSWELLLLNNIYFACQQNVNKARGPILGMCNQSHGIQRTKRFSPCWTITMHSKLPEVIKTMKFGCLQQKGDF